MQSFTFFLLYRSDPLFARSLARLQFLCRNMLGEAEILVFYSHPLTLEKLAQKYPHVRWRRIIDSGARKKTFALLSKAMRIARGDVLFYLDGNALYSLADFMLLLNSLSLPSDKNKYGRNKSALQLTKDKNFLRTDATPMLAYRYPAHCVPFFSSSIGTPTKSKWQKLKNKFFCSFAKEQNRLYTKIFGQDTAQNFKLTAWEKKSLQIFFSSLSKKEQLQILRQKLPTQKSFSFDFLFFNRQTKNPLLILNTGRAWSRFFVNSTFAPFSFYPAFFQFLKMVFKYRDFPHWANSSLFSVPVIHVSSVLFLLFFFSPLVRITSFLILILFLLPFCFDAQDMDYNRKISWQKFIFFPWQMLKKLFCILFL